MHGSRWYAHPSSYLFLWAFAAYLAGLWLGLSIITIIHETGHAVAAKLIGYNVKELVLGSGVERLRITLSGTDIVLRGNILLEGGHVLVSGGDTKLAMAVWIFAGPCLPVLVSLVLMVRYAGASAFWAPRVVLGFALMALISFVGNLWSSGASLNSDGAKIRLITHIHFPPSLRQGWFDTGYTATMIGLGAFFAVILIHYQATYAGKYVPAAQRA